MNRIASAFIFCIVSDLVGTAQSTSNPILIEPRPSSCAPAQGNCYLTVSFLGGTVNQHQNWYTSFISKSQKGNLTISINQQLESGNVSDSKASDPIDLKKNGSDLSISYQGPLVSSVPLTFNSIGFDVQITQTAHDDLGDLLTQMSKMSATTLPVSAATLGYVSAAKQITDFLFNAQLLQHKATGSFSFTPSTAPAPGVYAVLAADSDPIWKPFVDGLKALPGGGLSSTKGPVQGITYYTYEVKYDQHLYPNLDAALSHVKSKPWANLYFGALTSAGNGWTLDQHSSIEDNLRKQMDDASTLLATDPDLTAEEKLTLGDQASTAINAAYQKRYLALVQAAAPPALNAAPPQVVNVGGKAIPANPTVLSVGHDAADGITRILNNLKANLQIAQ